METAKDILEKHGVVLIGDNPKIDAAIREIADKAWEAGDTYRSEQFASMLGQENAADIVPDKSTFMKSLFPLKEI